MEKKLKHILAFKRWGMFVLFSTNVSTTNYIYCVVYTIVPCI